MLPEIINYHGKRYLRLARSYEPKDIPKHFYLATYLRPDWAPQFAKLELQGVQGISASADIITYYIPSRRSVLLIMDGPETARINKLSRILYDNPLYLSSKKMNVMDRILDVQSPTERRKVYHSLIDHIEKVFRELARSHKGIIRDGMNTVVANVNSLPPEINTKLEDRILKTSHPAKIAMMIIKALIDQQKGFELPEEIRAERIAGIESIPMDLWIKSIEAALKSVVATYKTTEAEWIVKDKKLHIPKGTKMYVVTQGMMPQKVERAHQLIDTYKLEEVLDIKFSSGPPDLGQKSW
jgi:hypothetical protein